MSFSAVYYYAMHNLTHLHVCLHGLNQVALTLTLTASSPAYVQLMRCLCIAGCNCWQTAHALYGSPLLCIHFHDILANARTVHIHMCACGGPCAGVHACLSRQYII